MSARLIRYTLDGIKLTHDISFGVTDADGFDVYINRNKLDKDLDYDVIGATEDLRDGNGKVALKAPHAASDVLLILSDTLARRVTNFAKATRFEESEIDNEFDNLLRLLEDATLYLTSTPYFNPVDIGLVDGQLPPVIAKGVLRVNEHKNGFELVELDKLPEFLEFVRQCTEQADRSESEADRSEAFYHAIGEQFIYPRIGNISDFAGQELAEAYRLNSYQYPDNSNKWYAPIRARLFPVVIPADPSGNDDWSVVNSLTQGQLMDSNELYNKIKKTADIAFLIGGNGDVINTTDGQFYYDDASTLDDDGGVRVGNWIRKLDGEIRYSFYGVPTGSDDLPLIKKAHAAANRLKLPVFAGFGGVINLNSDDVAEVKTSTDLNGCEVVIGDSIGVEPPYLILPSDDKQPFEMDSSDISAMQSELTEKQFILKSLSGKDKYRNCYLGVKSDQLLANRNRSGTLTPYNRESHIYHTRSGNLIGHIMCDMTSGNLAVTCKPKENSWLKFGNCSVTSEVTSNKKFSLVRSKRLMTLFDGINPTAKAVSTNANNATLIQWSENAFTKMTNMVGDSFGAGITSTYLISCQRTVKVDWDNVNGGAGWGVTNTNWIQEWTAKDCQINRIDNHLGIGNADFTRCSMTLWNILIGYGVGTINATDCKFEQGFNEYKPSDDKPLILGLVKIREGWQLGYRGNINIIRPKISIKSDYPAEAGRSFFAGVDCGQQYFSGCNATNRFYFPNVKVEDPVLNITGGELTSKVEFGAILIWSNYVNSLGFVMPDTVLLSNPSTNDKTGFVNFKLAKAIQTNLDSTEFIEKQTNFIGVGVKNQLKQIDITSIVLADYAEWQQSSSLFDWASFSENQDGSRVTLNFELDRCRGSIYSNCKNTKFKAVNSVITNLVTVVAGVSTFVAKISNSVVYPSFRGGPGSYKWYFATNGQKQLMTNCEIPPCQLSTGDVESVSARDSQRLIGCYTLASAPIDQAGVDRLDRDYETSGMYKSPTP